jgi:transcription initiation factor TFIIH subunit 1
MTSSEDVLYQINHVKHKKDVGTLYVMYERICWIQGNRDVVSVSHNYADIKSQKISSEGKPKIQLQIVLHENNSTFTFEVKSIRSGFCSLSVSFFTKL